MRNRRSTSWLLGFAGSAVVHVCLLGALFLFGSARRNAGARVAPPSDPIALVDVDPAAAGADPLAAAIPVEIAPPARAFDAHEGDRDSLVPITAAPSDSDGRRRLAPAPDQGDAGGHAPDHAFRRDTSTLRSHLSDGAAESQPARTRTGDRLASPQAIRREPVVGIGDSVRTIAPRRAPSPSAASEVALGGPTGAGVPGNQAEAPAASESLPVPSAELAALALPTRGTGPLNAEQGARSFDDERPGKAASEETLRAASNELHPGLTDFTHPTAPGKTLAAAEGRGPGARPGAVARPASGRAPSEFGAPDRVEAAADIAERARARRYERSTLEIQQRVNRVLEFPKPLALRLEQGVTIVHFVVGADGRLSEGPRVVKSSGFDEFDSAAIRAVRRAAPFPAIPFPVELSMSVIFDNPVIR